MPKWDGQICKICNQNDKTFYDAPDNLWAAVVPPGKNVVCLSCFDDLCAEKGIDYAPLLTNVGFIGHQARLEFTLQSTKAANSAL